MFFGGGWGVLWWVSVARSGWVPGAVFGRAWFAHARTPHCLHCSQPHGPQCTQVVDNNLSHITHEAHKLAAHTLTRASHRTQVVYNNLRPEFPRGIDPQYRELAQRCWAPDAADRPTMDAVVQVLSGGWRPCCGVVCGVARALWCFECVCWGFWRTLVGVLAPVCVVVCGVVMLW